MKNIEGVGKTRTNLGNFGEIVFCLDAMKLRMKRSVHQVCTSVKLFVTRMWFGNSVTKHFIFIIRLDKLVSILLITRVRLSTVGERGYK